KELSSIKDKSLFAPEVYYILGIAYYWSGDKVLAIESFQSALNQINNGTHALHGFDTNNLKNVLQKNLTTLLENE
ncbi:tetratricopeptide repeat protein, partial [Bacteroides caecigallinarum]|uniref:tetratricopeptide repeat protein n=1 Tax=Bacteroides caecigallinarum TaxID=1411144 RepID=UPI001F33D5E2